MKTKWQRQILAVVKALKEGATKCEQMTGQLFEPGWESDGIEVAPTACALGAIFIDGKNVARIRSVSYDKVYKEHPVLRTEIEDEYGLSEELGDEIIRLNDSRGLSFEEIISWLRKLARRKAAPRNRWPSYGLYDNNAL